MSSSEPIKGKCGAKLKRDRGFCSNPPLQNGRCRFHGGKSIPPGPGHPRYESGKYSKIPLQRDLNQAIEEAKRDEELLSLRRDIALIGVRSHELINNLCEYAGLHELGEMDEKCGELRDVLPEDATEAREKLAELQKLIRTNRTQERTWRELEKLTERRRKLVDSERNAMVKAGELITTAEAMHAMNSLVAVVLEKADSDTIRAIRSQFAAICGQPFHVREGEPEKE